MEFLEDSTPVVFVLETALRLVLCLRVNGLTINFKYGNLVNKSSDFSGLIDTNNIIPADSNVTYVSIISSLLNIIPQVFRYLLLKVGNFASNEFMVSDLHTNVTKIANA